MSGETITQIQFEMSKDEFESLKIGKIINVSKFINNHFTFKANADGLTDIDKALFRSNKDEDWQINQWSTIKDGTAIWKIN